MARPKGASAGTASFQLNAAVLEEQVFSDCFFFLIYNWQNILINRDRPIQFPDKLKKCASLFFFKDDI